MLRSQYYGNFMPAYRPRWNQGLEERGNKLKIWSERICDRRWRKLWRVLLKCFAKFVLNALHGVVHWLKMKKIKQAQRKFGNNISLKEEIGSNHLVYIICCTAKFSYVW